MSETHADPPPVPDLIGALAKGTATPELISEWVNHPYVCTTDIIRQAVAVLLAARAFDATQIATLTDQLAAIARQLPPMDDIAPGYELDQLVAGLREDRDHARAQLATRTAERDNLARHIDRAWAMLANCYDIESREECENSPLTHDGFVPLEMAIHAIHKRDPKVARLREALEAVVACLVGVSHREAINAAVDAWSIARSALSTGAEQP